MKVAVIGLWHLGSVTAACLAGAGHEVMGYDTDSAIIKNLQQGQAPLFEPGLNELIAKGIMTNCLQFTTQPQLISQSDVVWVAYDTPVDDNDIADVDFVLEHINTVLPHLKQNALVIVSSQMPVGTTRKLQQACSKLFPNKHITFAYSPENLRLGKAIDVFTKPDRVVVGLETQSDKEKVQTLLAPFTQQIIWMSIESAEMTKHALNAFLATSVVFINELSTICERVGADAREVERGLKSEERIGPKAYVRPGAAIGGGTLARDVNFLIEIGKQQDLPTPFFSALLDSNHLHKQWSCRRITEVLQGLSNKKIGTLGLTYKAGTDTLRRSTAIETCEWLHQQGAKVVAFDPVVSQLPEHLNNIIDLKATLEEALEGVDAVIVTTEWPEFTSITADKLLSILKHPHVFDPSGFLMKQLGNDNRVQYYSVGKCA